MSSRVFLGKVLATLFVATLVVTAVVGLFPASVQASSSCVTSNLKAYDMGGGTPWNPNYVIDVYSVKNTDGHFLYWNPLGKRWMGVKFSPWYPINNGAGVRWGLSTHFAWLNPFWNVTVWRYVYPC